MDDCLMFFRMPADSDSQPKERNMRVRPLYDIPYMYEAREFLRKKLIGKKVCYFSLNHVGNLVVQNVM